MMTRRMKTTSTQFARMRVTDREKDEIRRMAKARKESESDLLRHGLDLVRAELWRKGTEK